MKCAPFYDLIFPEWDGGCVAQRKNTNWSLDQQSFSLKHLFSKWWWVKMILNTFVALPRVMDIQIDFFIHISTCYFFISKCHLPPSQPPPPEKNPLSVWCHNQYFIAACYIWIFISLSPSVCLQGDQRQETIPAGSGATSSQEDDPQTRADRGAEAGDQGGLWAVWHGWIWFHRCQGAQSKRNLQKKTMF